MGTLLLVSWALAFLVTTTPTQLSSPPPSWGGAARAWFRWVTNRPLRYGDVPIHPLLRLFAAGAALVGGGRCSTCTGERGTVPRDAVPGGPPRRSSHAGAFAVGEVR